MNKNYNIQEIIRGCLRSEPLCQRALVDQYSGLLHVICQRYLGHTEAAKDAMQDSLIKIFKNLNKYQESKGVFESWISTITIRLCLTKMRKKKLSLVPLDHPSTDTLFDDIEADVLSNYDIDFLVAMITELPEIYRSVFNLVAVDGYSHKEVSQLLDIPIGTSRGRLNRAKKILKDRVLTIQKNESWVNTI